MLGAQRVLELHAQTGGVLVQARVVNGDGKLAAQRLEQYLLALAGDAVTGQIESEQTDRLTTGLEREG